MILGVLTVLLSLFGSGVFSFEYARDAAEEVIKDKDRAKQVVSITKQADEEYETFTENLEGLSEKFVQLNTDYDLRQAEIDAFTRQAENNRMEFLDNYVDLVFQMKGLMTEDEWMAMQSIQHKD
jgi:hypothetical protein